MNTSNQPKPYARKGFQSFSQTTIYPYLPKASVGTTKPAAYMDLLAEEAAP